MRGEYPMFILQDKGTSVYIWQDPINYSTGQRSNCTHCIKCNWGLSSPVVIKYSVKSSLKEKVFICLIIPGYHPSFWESQINKYMKVHYIHSQKQNTTNYARMLVLSSVHLLLYSLVFLDRKWCLEQWAGLPTSTKVGRHAHRLAWSTECSLRFLFQAILCCGARSAFDVLWILPLSLTVCHVYAL